MDIVQLKELVNNKLSTRKIAKILGYSQSYISKVLKKLDIKTSPYKDKGYCIECNKELNNRQTKYCSNKCQRIYEFSLRKENIENETSTRVLKRYLIEKDNRCSICSNPSEWEFKNLVLILDHIDGNSDNNNLDNLRLVCPNCDSQLPTFKGRNTGNGRYYRKQRYKKGKSY